MMDGLTEQLAPMPISSKWDDDGTHYVTGQPSVVPTDDGGVVAVVKE